MDSLQKVLKTNTTNQEKVNTYNALIKAYLTKKDSSKILYYANKALHLGKQSDYLEGTSDTYFYLGRLYQTNRYHKEAEQHLQKSLQTLKATKSIQRRTQIYFTLGKNHLKQGNYPQAISYFNQALEVYKNQPDDELRSNIYLNMTNALIRRGAYPQALDYGLKSLKIREKTANPRQLKAAYNTLGIVYYYQQNYPKTLEYYEKALKVNLQMGRKYGVALNQVNIGYVYYQLKNYSKALKYFFSALEVMEVLQNKSGLASCHFAIGEVLVAQKKYDEALIRLKKAQKGEAENIDSQAAVNIYLGRIYFEQKQYKKAILYLNKGLGLAKKNHAQERAKIGYQLLAQTYEALGNYRLAYQSHQLFKQMADSLSNEKAIKKFTRLEVAYQFNREKDSLKLAQSKEKALLSANIRQQKTAQQALGLGLGLSVLLIVTLVLFYVSKRRSNRLLTLTNDQLLSLDNFKQQMMGMIVHDLKNPLNSIIGLSEKQDDPHFFNAINHSGKRMQTLIMNILDVQKLEESTLPLRKNNTSLNDLLQDAVQQSQFITQEKKQTITTQIPDSLQVKVDQEIINRVLINLLTNASKFTPQNNPIHIQCEVVNNRFCKIMVKDTGVGIAAEHLEGIFDKFYQVSQKKTGVLRSTGLGLTFCKLAIEAHQGQIGVQSTPGQGATFWFTLPLSKQEQVVSEPTIATIQDNAAPEVLSFTPKELGTLQPIAQQIMEFDIFETSNIVNALKPLNTEDSQNLQLWKKEIEDTLYTHNGVRFRELVNLVLD
ncbi:hypothetical protein BKI52_14195 [marine bacterium AO1-C]|nr:hypothetical protein BKI52_14195 [marine bacterium AO1-C]